jgi:hypothetical protein
MLIGESGRKINLSLPLDFGLVGSQEIPKTRQILLENSREFG